MKRALRDAIIFIICFMFIFTILDRKTFEKPGTTEVWDYIQDTDREPIDILFMGNSHAYCSVNPVIINQCMDLNTMILGAGSQPMDQVYENMKVLLHYTRPKVIVLESYALAATTELVYGRRKEGLLYSNFDGIHNPVYKLGAIVHSIKWHDKWPEAYSQVFRPNYTWTRFRSKNTDTGNSEEENKYILGFRPQHNIVKNVKEGPDVVEKKLIELHELGEPLRKPAAKDALREFLDLTAKEKIPVYIFMSPILDYDNEAPKIAAVMDGIAQSDPAVCGYINFSEQMTSIGIEADDFSDLVHLNREGANKFTIRLMDWLSGQLGIPYDLSKATGIGEESIQELPDGRYRYTVSLLDNTLIKFITRDENGYITSETEFSDVNYIDMPRISEGNSLSYVIRAKREIPGRSYPLDKIEYSFMHDKGVDPDAG